MDCEESDINGVHWAFKLSANLVPCGAHVRYTCESHGPMATGRVERSFNKEKKTETVSIYSFCCSTGRDVPIEMVEKVE